MLRRLPGERRQALLGAARGVRYRGAAVECPCCTGSFSRFVPHRGRPNARCPGCGSLERHRLLVLYLERETDLFERPGALLHVAPEYGLYRRLSRVAGLEYVSGDLEPDLAPLAFDVTSLPFAADSFDFALCNHVLEHVTDDRRAMAEILRVLKPGGWAILMAPVDRRRERTLEDPAVDSPAERDRVYGQSDHLRRYGRDYPQRLREAGFGLRVEPYLDRFEEREVTRRGLRREHDEAFGTEEIYRCVKPVR